MPAKRRRRPAAKPSAAGPKVVQNPVQEEEREEIPAVMTEDDPGYHEAHENHLAELEAERKAASQLPPISPFELAALVVLICGGDQAAMAREISDNPKDLAQKFTCAYRLVRSAAKFIALRPSWESKESQYKIDKFLKSLPTISHSGHVEYSFGELLKPTGAAPPGRKKAPTILEGITTRTGLIAAIRRNFQAAEADRIIASEKLTHSQRQILDSDPHRRRARKSPS